MDLAIVAILKHIQDNYKTHAICAHAWVTQQHESQVQNGASTAPKTRIRGNCKAILYRLELSCISTLWKKTKIARTFIRSSWQNQCHHAIACALYRGLSVCQFNQQWQKQCCREKLWMEQTTLGEARRSWTSIQACGWYPGSLLLIRHCHSTETIAVRPLWARGTKKADVVGLVLILWR